MMESRVAIILTTYNRSHLVQETLMSIQKQSEQSFRCFIIDDFSEDNTAEVVQQFIQNDRRFSFHRKKSGEPKGLSASRNIGLELIKNESFEFLQFFDDDDLMHADKLKIQIQELEANPKAQLSLCGSKNFINKSEIIWEADSGEFSSFKNQLWDAYLIGEVQFVAQVPLFRRNFFNNYKFDEDLFYAEEWVLFVQQFYKEKPEYTITDKILFFRRKHEKSITSGGTRDFKVRKTSAVAGIKVFDYLAENNIHSKVSILHYSRYFLLYNYDSGILENIKTEIHRSFPELINRFKISRITHGFFRKIILRILKY